MTAVGGNDCVNMNKSATKKLQECNGNESNMSNGKLTHQKNGHSKNATSNGVVKHNGAGDAPAAGIPWMDWTGYDVTGGDFEKSTLLTAILTHLGLYLLMLLGFINQLLFTPKVAKERNREGYAPLYNPFEQFFSRNVYRRVKHCFNRPITSTPGAEVTLRERYTTDYNWTFQFTDREFKCINLGSYNYLGFAEAAGPCADAAAAAARRYGLSLCSPRAELGECQLHRELEATTAEFLGVESAIVFGAGFATNALGLPGLFGPGDLVLSDENNHASLILGLRLSRVTVRVFKHNDVRHLERLARTAIAEGKWRKIIVVVEGVYSMEGSVVPLRAILALKQQYKLYLYLDEAHSVGAMGPRGRGVADYCGVEPRHIDVLMGTFTKSFGAAGGYIAALKQRYKLYLYLDEAHSVGAMGPRGRGVADYCGVEPRHIDVLMGTFTKSFGAAGGYIAGPRRLVEWVRAHGHAHTYAHGMSPPVAQQIVSSMRDIMAGPGVVRVRTLRDNTHHFRDRLRKMGVVTFGHADSPVVPMLVYTFSKMAATVERLMDRGIATVGVGFPATPLNKARIRFCLSAAHTREQLDKCLDAIEEVADELGLRYSRLPRDAQ